MSYQDIRDAREGFVRQDVGDNLIKVESFILGVVGFFVLLLSAQAGFVTSLVLGIVIAGVVPVFVGLVPAIAWVVGIVFSLIWAYVGYVIGYILLGDSVAAGFLVGACVFTGSLFAHKVFAGLGYSSVEKIKLDAMDNMQRNLESLNDAAGNQNNNAPKIVYCNQCGAKLSAGSRFCSSCGNRL